MAGYSTTEVETSVSGFVKSDIEVEHDVLGPTDVANKFNEVLQLISSTLVFDPNAIFYLIYLATNRLNTSVIQAIEYIDDLDDAIDEVGHRTTEVTRTTLLGDAAAALLSVDTILTQSGAISNNAFTRYKNSVDSFISASLEPNIKLNASIVRPSPKARGDITTTLPVLSALYEYILTTLSQIKDMLDEFNELNLPVLSIQGSVRKARADLQTLQDIFEDPSTTRDDKIAECRDAYLRLVSGKAVLNNFTTVSDPSEPRLRSTTSLLGRSVEPLPELGVLVPAFVEGSVSAPWDIETGNNDTLSIAEDGNTPTVYTLVPPAFPSVENFKGGPYDIHGASSAQIISTNPENYTIPAFPDNEFVVFVDGVEFRGNIIAGGPYTGSQIAAALSNITDAETSTIVLGSVVVVDYLGGVRLTAPAGEHSIVIGDTSQSPIPTPRVNTVLGFTSGASSSGQDANDRLEIDVLSPLITLTQGATRTRADVAADITAWVLANYPDEYTAVDDGSHVVITKTKPGAQTIRMTAEAGIADATVLLALSELGFYEGQTDSADSMSGDEVIDQINAVGKIKSSISRTLYEEGNDGTMISSTEMTIPGGLPTSRAGKTLLIRNGVNAGAYYVRSTGGTTLEIIFGEFPDPAAIDQSYLILDNRLVLTSLSSTTTTALIIGVASANDKLGLIPGTYKGTTTGFRATESGTDANFLSEDVIVGDILRIQGELDRTVLERSDDKQLEVTPPLETGRTSISFQIISAAAVAYGEFVDQLTTWEVSKSASKFYEDLSELERVMNPLIVNKTPSLALLSDAGNTVADLRKLLTQVFPLGLKETLEGFEVAAVGRMEASLNMIQERGLDRAYDYLLDGKIAAFFGFDKDDAALSTYMMKTMRSVVQDDLPLSKLDEDADDIIHDELIVDSDADYDFSDIDDDEGLELLGEVADLSDDDVDGIDADFYRKRY